MTSISDQLMTQCKSYRTKKKKKKKCNQTKGFLLICNADTADDQCDDETDYGNTAPADD